MPDETSEQPAKTSKVADRPHYVSIVLSIVAVAISCLSWWESSRNRLLNEEINRPVLSIASIDKALGAVEIPESHGSIYSFSVHLKNNGKSTARTVDGDVMVYFDGSSDTACRHIPWDMGPMWKEQLNRPEALPGIEEELFGEITLTPACEKSESLRFQLFTTVTYEDVNSGRQYFQRFANVVRLSPKELRAKPWENFYNHSGTKPEHSPDFPR